MNREDSFALYKKGKEEWMTWVNEKRAKKQELIEGHLWLLDVDENGILEAKNVATKNWLEDSTVDFSSHDFQDPSVFDGFEFPAMALFNESKFTKEASFDNVIFEASVGFRKTTFQENTSFRNTKFHGPVQFLYATFYNDVHFEEARFDKGALFSSTVFAHRVRFHKVIFNNEAIFFSAKFTGKHFADDVVFDDVTFYAVVWFNEMEIQTCTTFRKVQFWGAVNFTRSVFENLTYFDKVTFGHDALFVVIQVNSLFELSDCSFAVVPDFAQAKFEEAPSLDRIAFNSKRNSANSASKWRSLKRIAIQAHDHEREQLFFAEEVKALRRYATRPFFRQPLRYWLGIFYQLFSNFGRSLLFPLMWWIMLTGVSAAYYFDNYLERLDPPARIILAEGKIRIDNNALFSELKCKNGQDEASAAAVYLAIHNGLVLSGIGRSNKLEQSYACLYGGSPSIPIMPNAVVFIGILQTLFSAVLIFLLLLAVRNQFRIR
jgi:hypothetical protein